VKNFYLPDTFNKIHFLTRINIGFNDYFIADYFIADYFIATHLSEVFRVHPCTKLKLSGGWKKFTVFVQFNLMLCNCRQL